MLAHRQALGLHRDVLHVLLIARPLERQHRFELGVVREGLRVLGRDGAALVVDLVFALLRFGETARDAVEIRRQQRADVDDDLGVIVLALARDVAGPEHRFGERLAHALRFIGVAGVRAELRVVLDEQQTRAGAAELDEMRFAALAAIETDIVRAKTPRQRRDEQERLADLAHAEQHAAFRTVAVEIEETRGTRGALRRRREVDRRLRGGLVRGWRGGERRQAAGSRAITIANTVEPAGFIACVLSRGCAQFARSTRPRTCRDAWRTAGNLHRRHGAHTLMA